MAPFSIDLPVSDKEPVGRQPLGEGLDERAVSGGLATALARLADAGRSGRAGRREDRVNAVRDAMAILDGLVSGAPSLDERWRSLPREILRVMQILLQANLSGRDAPLRAAADALAAVHQAWISSDAAAGSL